MFAEALGKSPLGAICRELNNGTAQDADGPLGDYSRTTRDAKRWGPSTVRRILLSPFYAALLPPSVPGSGVYRGERVDLDKCAPGAWDAIISTDELRGARRELLDPSRLQHDGTARRWLLSGLAVCNTCGDPVRSARTRKGVHGYRCKRGHFLREGDWLDRYAAEVIIERLCAPDAASLIQPPKGVDIPALRAREAALESELEEKFKLTGTGPHFTAERVIAMSAPVEAELDQVRADLAQATAGDALAEIVGADDVRAAWDRLSLARRRRIMRELLVVVIPPIGKGRRVLNLEDAAASVAIVWRKPNRPNVALPIIATEAGMGLHPDLGEAARVVLAGLLA
jgi:site-specific DNA recombinase